jgi:hypothetical protein
VLQFGNDDSSGAFPADGFVEGMDQVTEDRAKRFVLRALIHSGLILGVNMER